MRQINSSLLCEISRLHEGHFQNSSHTNIFTNLFNKKVSSPIRISDDDDADPDYLTSSKHRIFVFFMEKTRLFCKLGNFFCCYRSTVKSAKNLFHVIILD